MTVKWLILQQGNPEEAELLEAAVIASGREAKIITAVDFYTDKIPYSNDDKVFPHLSITMHRILAPKNPNWIDWTPLGTQLNCSSYYAYYGKYCLNQNYTLLPWAEAYRKKHELMYTYGEMGSVFMRPDSNNKIFTGRKTRILDVADDSHTSFEHFIRAELQPDCLVMVTEPKVILKEYRCFMRKRKFITGSMYGFLGMEYQHERIPGEPPEEVIEYCEELAKIDFPNRPPCYAFDIAETKEGLSLIELTPINCCGFYLADYPKLVKELSECAESLTNF